MLADADSACYAWSKQEEHRKSMTGILGRSVTGSALPASLPLLRLYRGWVSGARKLSTIVSFETLPADSVRRRTNVQQRSAPTHAYAHRTHRARREGGEQATGYHPPPPAELNSRLCCAQYCFVCERLDLVRSALSAMSCCRCRPASPTAPTYLHSHLAARFQVLGYA